MMLHDKVMPGQLFFDLKHDFTSGLVKSSPPQNKLDNYGAYHFLHQHHLHHHLQQQRLSPLPADGEALDLSRRCDSVETRKTPSPYNSTSSFGTASPSTHCGSPTNPTQTKTPTSALPATPVSAGLIPNKLHFPKTSPPPLHQGIASLYPLYYPSVKQEILSPPPPTAGAIIPNSMPIFPIMNGMTPPPPYSSPTLEEQKCSNIPYSRLTDAAKILYPNILNAATTGTINSSKATRPFNAYPRDPDQVAAHFSASDALVKNPLERYSSFRKRALNDLRVTNGGHRVVTNPKMRRTNNRNTGPSSQNSECEERAVESSDNDSSTGNGSFAENSNKNDDSESNMNFGGGIKDEAYYERRRKNNAAAKKSRDRRRIKEDEIAIRAAYLERQNIELLCQIDALKKQLEMFTKA